MRVYNGIVVVRATPPGDVFSHLDAVIDHAGEEGGWGERIITLRNCPLNPRDKGEIVVKLFFPKGDDLLEIAALGKRPAGRAQALACIGIIAIVKCQLQQLHHIDIDGRNAGTMFAGIRTSLQPIPAQLRASLNRRNQSYENADLRKCGNILSKILPEGLHYTAEHAIINLAVKKKSFSGKMGL